MCRKFMSVGALRRLRSVRFAGVGIWFWMWMLGHGAAVRGADSEYLANVDDKWRYLQSQHFELYSRNDEPDSRELLHNLELLHTEFAERFKFVPRARLDVTVYFFRRMEDFRYYAPDNFQKSDFFRGFYQAGPDRAVISVAPLQNWDDSQRLIFHEYVHHLFRAMEADPPVWFNEGMAELLASIRVEGDQLEIGHAHAGRIVALRQEKLLPLETLFAVEHDSPIYRSSNHTGLFYAESWALLHYWEFGKSGIPPAAVERFLRVASDRKLAAQVNLRAYFRECFAMDYPDMLRRLDSYVVSGSYQYSRHPVPKIDPKASYAMRAVPRDEMRARLAELALRVNRSIDAKIMLSDVAARPAVEPRVFEALGAYAFAEHDDERVREYWEHAVAAGSTNSAVLRQLAVMESEEWFNDFDYDFQLPPDLADRLRVRLERSISAEPQQTEPYEMLAWVEAYAPKPKIENINLIQRHFPTLQHRDRALVALSLVRQRTGMIDEAKAMLAKLPALDPDRWSLQAAETINARLEDRRPRRVSGASDHEITVVAGAANPGDHLPQRGGVSAGANVTVVADGTDSAFRLLHIPSVELPAKPQR